MQRLSRIARLLGTEKVQKLQRSYVAVIGLGAVGSYATEALARAGIGRLLLVDFDTVHLSNINRQLFALESTLGRYKADVAKARVLDINPHCRVDVQHVFVDQDTRPLLVAEKPDLVIDAIDAVAPKAELLTYCYKNDIPVFASMGAALRTDPLQIKTGDVFDVTCCPLAAQIRRRLRKNDVGRGIQCVYSTEPVAFDYTQTIAEAEPQFTRGRKRNVLGSLPTLTGIFGLTLANMGLLYLSNTKK
jgi:tRNA A37 threonylcarbamoyladenosine dehydratase